MFKKIIYFGIFILGMASCQNPSKAPTDAGKVQVINIEVNDEGYSPSNISIKSGTPIKLVVTRKIDSECAAQIMSEKLGIKPMDLPLNKPVEIDLPAQKEGYYRFACGMNMLQGMIVVKS